MNDHSENLLSSIKRGDRLAFDRLFKDYFETLCNYAFLLVRDKTAAEEIASEVFYRIWFKRNEIHVRGYIIYYKQENLN